jgi:hypothetical protein
VWSLGSKRYAVFTLEWGNEKMCPWKEGIYEFGNELVVVVEMLCGIIRKEVIIKLNGKQGRSEVIYW